MERSWKTLVRIISAITIVFSGLGSIAVFWGYNTYEDISEKSGKIEVLTKKSNIIVEKAKENLDALSNTKVLREVQYDLENVRQQLFLDLQDEKIKDMSLDNWWSGLILYREAIENLKGYIANPEPGKHEPESVLKAIDIILELSQQNILPLDAKGLLEIHKSLLALARAGVGDWRVRREIASKAETLGKLATGTLAKAKQEILRDWRDLFINMPLNNRFRINVAMILSSLGDWSNDIKHLFLEILSDRRERKWSKRNAAISLIEIGRNEEGFDYLVKESEKMDIDGLWSSIYIARLTRGEIEKITTLPSLGKRIIEKLGYVKRYTPDRLNFFIEGYALKISQCLSEGNTPPDCRNRHW